MTARSGPPDPGPQDKSPPNPAPPLAAGAFEQLPSDAAATAEGRPPEAPTELGHRLATGFRLVGLIGKGGVGTVWECEQRALRRLVAVKQLNDERVGDDPGRRRQLRSRFELESIVAALLDHPNILPVYDLTEDEAGNLMLAMKRVRGTPWASVLAADFRAMAPADFLARHLPILHALCQAVAYAHSRGIVHRDLKPAQVMVGDFSEVLLIDWGLALCHDPILLAQAGNAAAAAVLPTRATAANPAGTVVYMAPEQTDPDARRIGPWTDVYLLGAILYQLLTGHAPHEGGTPGDSFRAAMAAAPPDVADRAADRPVPAELAELCRQAMAPDPAHRPRTAAEFARRLGEYLSGDGCRREAARVVAEVESRLAAGAVGYAELDRLQQETRRARALAPNDQHAAAIDDRVQADIVAHSLATGDLALAEASLRTLEGTSHHAPLAASLAHARTRRRRLVHLRRTALVLIVLLVVATLSAALSALRHYERAELARHAAELARGEAIASAERARIAMQHAEEGQYLAAIGYASSSLRDNDVAKARELLTAAPVHLRGWEWSHLRRLFNRDGLNLRAPRQLLGAAWSPDGEQIALCGEDFRLMLWNWRRGEFSLHGGHSDKIYAVNYSPSGAQIATASKDRTVRLWDATTGNVTHVLDGHGGFVNAVVFSPDGTQVLSASSDFTARLWNTSTGGLRHVLRGHADRLFGGAFSPDGATVYTVGRDRRLILWDTATGEPRREVTLPTVVGLTAVAVHPDGHTLAVGSWSGEVLVLDAESLDIRHRLDVHDDAVFRAEYSPNGQWLLTPSHDKTIRIWNTADYTEHANLIGHDAAVWGARFNPDGRLVVSAGYDAMARLWEVDLMATRMTPLAADAPTTGVAGPVIRLHASDDPSLRDLDSLWRPQGPLAVLQRADLRAAVHAGDLVVAPQLNHRVRLGAEPALQPDGRQPIPLAPATRTAVFVGDGTRVVLGGAGLALWDAAAGTPIATVADPPDVSLLAAGNEHVAAVAGPPIGDAQLVVHRIDDTFARTQSIRLTSLPFALALSPDGRRAAVSGGFGNQRERGDGRDIHLIDIATGELESNLDGHAMVVWAMVFHPDGKRLASASHDGSVRIWDPVLGREMLHLRAQRRGFALGLAFEADGRALLAATSMGEVEVYDAGLRPRIRR